MALHCIPAIPTAVIIAVVFFIGMNRILILPVIVTWSSCHLRCDRSIDRLRSPVQMLASFMACIVQLYYWWHQLNFNVNVIALFLMCIVLYCIVRTKYSTVPVSERTLCTFKSYYDILSQCPFLTRVKIQSITIAQSFSTRKRTSLNSFFIRLILRNWNLAAPRFDWSIARFQLPFSFTVR